MNILSLYNNNILRTNGSYLNELSTSNIARQAPKEGIEKEKHTNFSDYINMELEKLNNQQIKADNLVTDFIKGDIEDIHTVLIGIEEARLSLELAVQVRNKCIEAYKEISNMQL